MDRKHGKRSLPLEEEEEKEEKPFPIYSNRSQQDMSAVVSALIQVIGGNPVDPITLSHSTSDPNHSNQQPSHPPPPHQGIYIYLFLLCYHHITPTNSCAHSKLPNNFFRNLGP